MDQAQVDEFLVMHGAGDVEIMTCDGLEDAFLGVVERFSQQAVALYDRDKVIQIFITRDGMTLEQAEEFFDYNVQGAWVGEGTPAFVTFAERPSSVPSGFAEPDMPLFPSG